MKIKVISMLLIVMLLMTSVACAESPITSVMNTLTNNVSKVMDLEGMTKAIKNVGNDMLRKAIVSFTDVSKHWARNYIGKLASVNVIKGYPDGSFKPNGNITVAEFTTLVLKAGKVDFPQTNPWYQGIVNKALAMGIIEEGEFYDYNRPINRGEMARMIVRALDEKPSSGNTIFKDDSAIPSKFKGYVKKANELGIIKGYLDNTFQYANNATRAEASTMIVKMLDPNYNEPAIYIPHKPLQQVDGFIEPVFEIHYAKRGTESNWFSLWITNKGDYANAKDSYKARFVCTNYKELNTRWGTDFYGDGHWFKMDITSWRPMDRAFWDLTRVHRTEANDNSEFQATPGMTIDLAITVRNETKGIEKTYYESIVVPKVDWQY